MASGGGNLPARMFTWIDGIRSRGAESSGVARLAHGDKFVLADAILDVRIVGALLAHGRLPGIMIAPRRLVVVAYEEARRVRQRQQLADGAVENAGVATGKVGPRRAVVGHEQRVAHEHRILDLVGDVCRRVARRMKDLDVEISKLEALAVGKEVVELAAVALHVGGVEHRAEDLLHVADMLADADLGAGLELDVGRAG